MITWAKIGLALLSLFRTLIDYLERMRVRKEVLTEQKEKQDEIIATDKVDTDNFDRLSPADRERVRNDNQLYRD